jgi:urea transport system substrate-binding protein
MRWCVLTLGRGAVPNQPALLQAETTDVEAMRQPMCGQKVERWRSRPVPINADHHPSKPVMTGDILPNRRSGTAYKTKHTIKADAWSPCLAEDKGKVADWTFPWVCGNCTEPKYKSYANC